MDLLLQADYHQLGKRGPSPGKHTEMVWSPVAGRWRRIFQKRRVENAWEIPFTQWERIIERTLERDEKENSDKAYEEEFARIMRIV